MAATRAEVLARYGPIRAGIRRVLRAAAQACGRADLNRAVKQVAPWADTAGLEDGDCAGMLVDVALFEPNQRGRRAFDRFLADRGERLTATDRALAGRMAGAWFSIFRVAGRQEAVGLWLEDMLAGDRRLWLVDEALEASAREGAIVGMRLFDAGPFHAGFGIIVEPDDETLDFCLGAKARGAPLPFRHALAATLYGDQLRADRRPGLPASPCCKAGPRSSPPSPPCLQGRPEAAQRPVPETEHTVAATEEVVGIGASGAHGHHRPEL